MAIAHRNGDLRACGATTIVSGQNFVFVDGQLWSVNGDANSHGNGQLISSLQNYITIGGIRVILVGDQASPDDLSPDILDGGVTPHDDPYASSGDSLINVT